MPDRTDRLRKRNAKNNSSDSAEENFPLHEGLKEKVSSKKDSRGLECLKENCPDFGKKFQTKSHAK